ncbi:PVC-type heme-binding CxxCH protein [Flavilitoribacter nigricans]|uniref:Cytochrome c domain-containing protein n=1 Tax=Flavilitoribacter nigricans (strain ATCC 23147 / DSM 23189 / NBRC 102662 / NCIMB 1420 / SS-2) TaxID=1122177 RepID=A0A2D0MZI4_FLAN2|nr:PVC-type heme-binding CxxCH protein [Flavilitoribacter nigricans]PHN01299.1 hypothetical protein CRP01_37700 [Flavilitoribacter nigricans DSM 23189 = NBRC 102662]
MKNHILFGLLLTGLFFSCQQSADKNTLLAPEELKKVVLVGGSLISGMEEYGFFERSLTTYFASEDLSFRNIGWPADDVYGKARSQFGSAQNTRSWAPPSMEAGFGSKVLVEHIEETAPTTLIIGYGGEAAFVESEADFNLFTSGYIRLLDTVEAKGRKIILLSAPKHEAVYASTETCKKQNEWLGRASDFIREQADTRGHHFVDLYSELITNPDQPQFTDNGVQLNRAGYAKMNEILLRQLEIPEKQHFTINIDKKAAILSTANCEITDWTPTVRGVSFNLTPEQLLYSGRIISEEPVAVYVNGQLVANSQDTLSLIRLVADSLQQERITNTIKEKNRLHRYRLRPLNEAYIYLFRRHEMGHLAYEMDNLKLLVEEKEREISRLLSSSRTYDVEIELIQPWQPPKNYPEDEVPAFVPEPDIAAELAAFQIADGYEISLFAADPMIANPININWDTKGRAWVATSSTYPHIIPGREPNDRIIILEDTDQDGVADKHTVFAEDLLVPHSVMPVPGGAFVTATTQLLFLADTDGDDVADERRVIYDGFGNADVHHMIHGLRWAPWGDLYFTQSIYINSFVETPYGQRILNGSGTWAFRPETERLEVFSRGLINPWGQTFDQWGQSFATDGAGSSGINYIFPESAHASAVGAAQVLPGLNSNTPKNTAAEIVYSRHFPRDWQGSIITNDFRANRTVRYQISPHQSHYQSEEVQTILRSEHRSYRPVDAKIGPDGALYIVDWYNPIIDHGEVDFYHPIRDKTHGRIWKLTRKGSPLLSPIDMQGAAPATLLNYLKSPEQFTRLQSNRAYVEQEGDPTLVINWIKKLPAGDPASATHRLEGLWLLTALNHYEEPLILAALRAADPRERAAAVRLLAHWKKQTDHLPLLAELIRDPHPQVRLETLHALREMGGAPALTLAMQVLEQPMDEYLDFALNLTLSTLKGAWLPTFATKGDRFAWDVHKQLYALVAVEDTMVVPPLLDLLEQADLDSTLVEKGWSLLAKIGNSTARSEVFRKAVADEDIALLNALANAPAARNAVPENLALLESVLSHDSLDNRIAGLRLASRWKAGQYEALISDRVETASDLSEKVVACRALVAMDQLDRVRKLAQSADDPAVRTAACAVWVEKAPEDAVERAVDLLAGLEDPEQAELIFNTFRRQGDGPEILQRALVGKQLPESVASVGLRVVQTSGLNLFDLEETLRAAGGIRAIGMEMSKAEKEDLIREAVESDRPGRGRQIYRKKELLCATCHRMDGIGGLTGPDLTTVGSYMTPNSILESILNPSSDIKQGYETVLLTKTDGEIISGLLHRKTNNATLIRLPSNQIIEVPAAEIAQIDVSPVSLMPPGLTRNLHRDELKDLLAFLISLGKEQ